ncbi:electron transport complex subunit RsxG [Shewanella sp. Choline-02u-19]|uniref:electron transport complex subunit RsxG n=1 Tax=unclassified Shewanella TaxID=196818 RepID=UPI000C31FEA5|nr:MULTISPECIES: electron transport complex subunit RsxG [unclassified Shewanella]PKG57990.1 electron transport complex subunit RsxG [Shewanella sp. GutDb-MelDb]PKG74276.1 electron transport complex subunit RsxG [Shewanella sp. GutCb]PKH55929.1 electron transport complex subunit RsxG [Shewanella sp. Bg11-22]PKI27375.1 electron transport complex subunit RsxG [Shewanella sp. Choline-02u-19]
MKNSMLKNGLLLALFALLCTGLVAVVNQLTFAKIKQQEQIELARVLHQIIPDELHDNELTEHCITITSVDFLGTDKPLPAYIATKEGIGIAIAIETVAPDGYNGDIRIIIGLDKSGTVLGVRTLSHQETPGLGDKIERRKSDWVSSFKGLSILSDKDKRWHVKKDGGEIDQFTGATITPRAFVKAVKKATLYFNAHKDELLDAPANCEVGNE